MSLENGPWYRPARIVIVSLLQRKDTFTFVLTGISIKALGILLDFMLLRRI